MRPRRPSALAGSAAVGLALTALSCGAPDEPAAPTVAPASEAALVAAVRSFVAPYVESRSFSGVVLIARGDTVHAHEGFGLANDEQDAPVTVDTKFQIASLSKSFTAAAILRLRERGDVSLDDRLSRFLPDFPRGDEITIHQLLVHTSGLARYVFQPDYAERSRQPHTADDLARWIANVPLALEPGERSAYSNANYAVLARVIEIVSGQSYGGFLDEHLIGLAGLPSTGHRGDAAVPVPALASGYVPVGLRDVEPSRPYDYSSTTGAGSLYSTASDLLQWYRSLVGGGVLQAESLELMFRPHVDARGYGWILDARLARPAVSLSGWDGVGFLAEFVHFEEEDLTVIVLCNLSISTVPTELADAWPTAATGRAGGDRAG